MNELPSIAGSSTPSNSNRSLSNGAAGINSINLRSLGNARTLVLLDGRRSVGSLAQGTVDINTFPQGLVKSIEIVTGGASATYGSDAVSGVVNFILDKTFTGLEGEARSRRHHLWRRRRVGSRASRAARHSPMVAGICYSMRSRLGAMASTACSAAGRMRAGTW